LSSSSPPSLTWQAELFAASESPDVDPSFFTLGRIDLDARSWVDVAPAWLSGSDALFERLLTGVAWEGLDRVMYGNVVRQPRLSARWEGSVPVPALEAARLALSERYGVDFDSVGLNLYRDGRDSVAWHGDRIPKEIVDPIVALVSLGHPRRFLLRPKGGGKSRAFDLGRGDLLVTGGACQREWQHSVPKVATAGPRISVAFRHSTNY
jgi:alkylated DNA repair dioxygenase AlkB